jgi:hypothetical protein
MKSSCNRLIQRGEAENINRQTRRAVHSRCSRRRSHRIGAASIAARGQKFDSRHQPLGEFALRRGSGLIATLGTENVRLLRSALGIPTAAATFKLLVELLFLFRGNPMLCVWRVASVGIRLLSAAALASALAHLIAPSRALAQSSVGQAANAATGRSLADAVDRNLNDFIFNEVLGAIGGDGAGTGTGAGAGSAGGGTLNLFPTGRVRGSNHGGLADRNLNPLTPNYGWETLESSAFVNVVYGPPGTVLGGQVKLAGFAGGNWLSLDLTNGDRGADPLDVANGQRASASNDSGILGGTALWSMKTTYAMATLVGFMGQTRLNDAADFCNGPGLGCPMRRYHFDTSGFIGTLTGGNVFKLTGSPTGPLLDIRGAASYVQNTGDAFVNQINDPDPDQQKYKFATWTVTASATLFTNIAMQNSGLLRPYLQTYVRQELDYRNKLSFVLDVNTAGATPGHLNYQQAHTYGGVDTGLTYTQGKMTVGAATYIDWSGDEFTWGGRVGASWKLN